MAVERNAPALIEPSPLLATSEPSTPDSSDPKPSAPAEATPANIPEYDREHAASTAPILKKLDQQQPGISSERDERNVVSDPGAGERCGDVLHRLQLGELLSDEDRTYLQNECGR